MQWAPAETNAFLTELAAVLFYKFYAGKFYSHAC